MTKANNALWIEKWMAGHAVLLLISCGIFVFTKNIHVIAGSAAISFAALFVWNGLVAQRISFLLEFANLITLGRLMALLGVSLAYALLPDHWIGIIALAVLILDGLDGYLARKFNTSSVFGAYLDMETDAFFVLSMTSILYLQEKVGFWILLIGCLRYAYFIVLLFFKPKEQKESREYFAQVIAVILMGSLISGFLLPEVIYWPALVIGSGLVVWSFGRSFFAWTSVS